MSNDHITKIAGELHVTGRQVHATTALLDEGATVPFIARYRKEATGSLDEVAIFAVRDQLDQLRELDKRREAILLPWRNGACVRRSFRSGYLRRRPWRRWRISTCPTGPSAGLGPPSPERRGWSPWPS